MIKCLPLYLCLDEDGEYYVGFAKFVQKYEFEHHPERWMVKLISVQDTPEIKKIFET